MSGLLQKNYNLIQLLEPRIIIMFLCKYCLTLKKIPQVVNLIQNFLIV